MDGEQTVLSSPVKRITLADYINICNDAQNTIGRTIFSNSRMDYSSHFKVFSDLETLWKWSFFDIYQEQGTGFGTRIFTDCQQRCTICHVPFPYLTNPLTELFMNLRNEHQIKVLPESRMKEVLRSTLTEDKQKLMFTTCCYDCGHKRLATLETLLLEDPKNWYAILELEKKQANRKRIPYGRKMLEKNWFLYISLEVLLHKTMHGTILQTVHQHSPIEIQGLNSWKVAETDGEHSSHKESLKRLMYMTLLFPPSKENYSIWHTADKVSESENYSFSCIDFSTIYCSDPVYVIRKLSRKSMLYLREPLVSQETTNSEVLDSSTAHVNENQSMDNFHCLDHHSFVQSATIRKMLSILDIAKYLQFFEIRKEMNQGNISENTADENDLHVLHSSDLIALRKIQFLENNIINLPNNVDYVEMERCTNALAQSTVIMYQVKFSDVCIPDLQPVNSGIACSTAENGDSLLPVDTFAAQTNLKMHTIDLKRSVNVNKCSRLGSANGTTFMYPSALLYQNIAKKSTEVYKFMSKSNDFDHLKFQIREISWLPDPVIERADIQVFFNLFEPLQDIVTQISVGHTPSPQVTMRYEMLRFCTFRTYPKSNKPFIMRLAQTGFYYAADGDGVVCYTCGIRRYNWTEEETPRDIHRRINPSCKFLTNNDEVNVPVKYFGVDKKSLVFIESIPDVEPNRNVLTEDEDQEPIRGQETTTHIQASTNRESRPNESLGISTALPKQPQYATILEREQTFKSWPTNACQTPATLADAGFYYAGFGDCVRCFYCGIGLRHWTSEDDPWIEHARWAQTCVYVRQKKGLEFVNLVQLAVQYSQDREEQSNVSEGNQLPDQEIEKILLSDAAQSVLVMGYQPRIIKRAIEILLQLNGQTDISSQSLREKVLEIEEQSNQKNSQAQSNQPTASTSVKSGNNLAKANEASRNSAENIVKNDSLSAKAEDPKAIKAENEMLKEQSLCKVCLDQAVCIVFLPCGHLVTCADCAPAMRKCPICRAVVRGTVRTYMM